MNIQKTLQKLFRHKKIYEIIQWLGLETTHGLPNSYGEPPPYTLGQLQDEYIFKNKKNLPVKINWEIVAVQVFQNWLHWQMKASIKNRQRMLNDKEWETLMNNEIEMTQNPEWRRQLIISMTQAFRETAPRMRQT